MLIPILCLLICVLVWFRSGKDTEGNGTIIAEYEPPLDLSPAEVGVVDDFKATHREITATLVDLAIRGYIRIRKLPKKRMLLDSFVYEFELLNDEVLDLRAHEKALLNGLFGVATVKFNAKVQAGLTDPEAKYNAQTQYPASKESFIGRKVSLDELDKYFFQYVEDAKQDIYDDLQNSSFFKSDILLAGSGLGIVGVLFILSGAVYQSYRLQLIASGLIFLLFALAMQARTRSGKIAKERVDGFKLFLQTVEVEKLRLIQSPSTAEYAKNDLVLLETYLPYAIALGLEGDWSKQFAHVYEQPASWIGAKPLEKVVQLSEAVKGLFR